MSTSPTTSTSASTASAPDPVYLDCDTGVDDAMALAYLATSSTTRLVGVGCVSGNVAASVAARNTADLLALLGLERVPVAVGAHDHLDAPFGGGAAHVHGEGGIGGVVLPRSGVEHDPRPAAQLLVDLAREHAGALRVLAVGPLTNLALALALEPELPSLVRDVTVMGGAALVPGNITPAAEANIAGDPRAAALVLSAPWDVTLVPLDVTMRHRLELDDQAKLRAAGRPVAAALADVLDVYLTFYTDVFGRPSCALHDPLAAAVLDGGAVPVRAPRVPVVVDDTAGPGRGQTLADLRGDFYEAPGHARQRPAGEGGVRVVLEVAQPFAPLLVERLLGA